MAKFSYEHGSTSVILRVKILDSTATDGSGKTGLAFDDAGLIISTIADVEAAKTVYTGANIENVGTLGTYAAPTAGKCRFREVDATNHPGIYEIHLADVRYAVSNARSLIVSIFGIANAAEVDAEIQLEPVPANVKEWKGSVPNDLTSGSVQADVRRWIGAIPLGLSASAVQARMVSSASNSIGQATFTTDAITASKFAADAANKIRDTILDDATRFSGADITAILEDTATTLAAAIAAIPTTAMRGTDSAALAIVCTEVRLAELAAGAGKLPADVDTLLARLTAARAALLDNLTNVMQPIRTGTAQAGAFESITLDASASVDNSFYKGFCQITGGLGVGQSAPIVGYDGTTKVLDISPAWSTPPDATSTFAIWPRGYDPATVLTESYAALGDAPTLEQALFAIQQGVLDFKVVGTTLTLRKLDGTDAMTFTLDNASNPTDRARVT